MKTYICYNGHLQYSSADLEDLYSKQCSYINCGLEVVELPKSKLERVVLNETKQI